LKVPKFQLFFITSDFFSGGVWIISEKKLAKVNNRNPANPRMCPYHETDIHYLDVCSIHYLNGQNKRQVK